jgi:hypothetical protein
MDEINGTPIANSLDNMTSHPAESGEDREFKAHIYQHLVDLQPFLTEDSQISVMVEQERSEGTQFTAKRNKSNNKKDTQKSTKTLKRDNTKVPRPHRLSIVITLGEYRLESEGQSTDLYEAFGQAKARMLAQLEELYSAAVDTSERDAQIQSLIEGHTIH